MSDDSRRQEWQQASSRNGRRNGHLDATINKVITKFFVLNLPPKCSSADLKEVFGGFGFYEGSYIARKSDRRGKRFGFISFRDVHDVNRLEGEMVDVWIGSYKLFVTTARFVDGVTKEISKNNMKEKAKMKDHASHAHPNKEGAADMDVNSDDRRGGNTVVGGGRSFLDSVLNRNKVDVIPVEDNVEGFLMWKEVALVGKVVDFNTLISLKRLLMNKGWKSVGIKYVGGFSVLLVFSCLEDAECFLSNKEVWASWFEGLGKWDGKYNQVERIAWLKVYGVPIQLAIDQVLDSIGSRSGRVVQSAKMSVDENNFSYAYIGVLTTSCSRLTDRVDISWRGFLFNVWVDEEVGEWVPECVEDIDYSSENMEQEDDCGNDAHGSDAQEVLRINGENVEEFEEGEIRNNAGSEELDQPVMDVDVIQNNVESTTNNKRDSVEGSKAGRKKFRRRQMFKNRGEASGSQERPKKRLRDDNDPFELDKLIGIMASKLVDEENDGSGLNDIYITPDLNSNMQIVNEDVGNEDQVEGIRDDQEIDFGSKKTSILFEAE